jgi:hypothetical protein
MHGLMHAQMRCASRILAAMTSDLPPDLAPLAERFPAWTFTATWITCASKADARLLRARRGVLVLSARDAGRLAAKVEAEEHGGR